MQFLQLRFTDGTYKIGVISLAISLFFSVLVLLTL